MYVVGSTYENKSVQQNKNKKTHMVILLDKETASDKVQNPFLVRTLDSVEIEGNFLNLISSIYEKSTSATNLLIKD